MADLPGTCVLEGGAAEARVQQGHSWAEQLVGGAACQFLAAKEIYQPCDCKLVVVLSDGVELNNSLRWATQQELERAKSPLVDTLMIVLTRVASFQGEPHELGEVQTSQRKAVANRPGKEALSNADGWRAGKTPVRLLKPRTHGEVNAGW